AWHVPGADHQVAVGERGQHLRQIGRVMRAVGILLDEHLVAVFQPPGEASDVGRAEAGLARAVHYVDVRIRSRQLVRDLAGPVRAAVVDHEYVRVRNGRPDPADNRLEVIALVVGRDDDGDWTQRSRRRLGRSHSFLPRVEYASGIGSND